MPTNKHLSLPCVCLVAAFSASLAFGQVVSGIVYGTATDSTGGIIPGVRVEAVNQETGLTRSALTSDAGFYTLEALLPGIYTVSAELTGFKRYERKDVQVTVAQRVRVDVLLEVGEITDSVTVTGGAMMVDTRSAELSSLVDDRRITDLPLSGRNVIALAALLPGVSTVSAPQVQTDARGGPRLTVHGGRGNQNYMTLNGTYFNQPSRNTMLNPPPPDAVREFRIKTNQFSASEGRNSGSIVSVVTRSGTNDFHGSVWEFHRNDNLNARSFFEQGVSANIQNQFGAAAGGPIIRDRIHVFASYEGFRHRTAPAGTSAAPPSQAERSGDFSHIKKPLINPFSGEPFAGNQIPTGLFDKVSQNILRHIPLPNTPDGRLVAARPDPNDNNLLMIRNDVQISDKQSLFWHYFYNRNDRPTQVSGNIPGWQDFSFTTWYHNFGLTHTWVVSPTLVNSFTFGTSPTEGHTENDQRRAAAELGFTGVPDYTPYGSLQFSTSGRFNLNTASQWDNTSSAYNFHESISWTRGTHTLKFGTEFFRLGFFQAWLSPPSFTFNGSRSGDAMADFMLGAWYTWGLAFGRRSNDAIQPYYWNLYFQDEWRLHPRLMLTLGLRYELPSTWQDKREFNMSTWVLPIDGSNRTKAPVKNAPPGYLFANFDLPAGLVDPDRNNFAPRFGLAYDLTGDGRTSLRVGAGLFYDTLNGDVNAQTNAPFAQQQTYYLGGPLAAPRAGVSETLPPVTPNFEEGEFVLPLTAFAHDMGLRTPYIYHWNLGLQRQLQKDLMISVDYVGKIAKRLITRYPWNPAVFIPGNDAKGKPLSTLSNANDRVRFGKGIVAASSGNHMLSSMFGASYHGLDVEVNRRFTNGFSLLAAYTFSKAIDESSSITTGESWPNPFHIREAARGLAQFHRSQVLSISALWSPMEGSQMNSPLRHLLSGWTLAPIFRITSGNPLSMITGKDTALDGTGSSKHPNVLRHPKKSHDTNHSKISAWFDTTAVEMPATGTYGNASRGLLIGPHYTNWDLAILRDFRLGGFLSEEGRLQFRAEFFNAFNHTHFGNPDLNLSSRRFGEIRSAGDGREIQFGLKLIW